jgi:hypothetical protein
VLVLDTYEPAIWRVSAGADSRIAAVLLGGNYTSSVEGLASGTPVVMRDHEGRELRPEPRAGCEPFHVHTGSAYRGGRTRFCSIATCTASGIVCRSIDDVRGNRLEGTLCTSPTLKGPSQKEVVRWTRNT